MVSTLQALKKILRNLSLTYSSWFTQCAYTHKLCIADINIVIQNLVFILFLTFMIYRKFEEEKSVKNYLEIIHGRIYLQDRLYVWI